MDKELREENSFLPTSKHVHNRNVDVGRAQRMQLSGEQLRRVAGANYSQLRQLERLACIYLDVEPRKKNARPNDVLLAFYGPQENAQVIYYLLLGIGYGFTFIMVVINYNLLMIE